MTPALRVAEVSHAFGGTKALEHVSVTVGEGEFVALLGANGAGKTTLFALVTRLYDNVSGTIEVFGHDVRRTPGPALAELGVVFQTRALDADLSVAQNFAYHAALHGLSRPMARERADAVAAAVGLGALQRRRVRQLSGGQQRRAEIARALLHQPRLLLLDEPTVGLDVHARREVVRLVRQLAAEAGVGVLWATHILDEVEPADRVVILHQGQVLADATAAEISGEGGLPERFLSLTGLERDGLR